MTTKFCVITEIPVEGDDGNMPLGNLASVFDLYVVGGEFPDKTAKRAPLMIDIRYPVFAIGEILVLNDSGREIGGDGRKPSKWSIDYQLFASLEEAIDRSNEVTG